MAEFCSLPRIAFVFALMTASIYAFTINIDFRLPKDIKDPNLIDFFKKITNVNATAIAESLDKRIIRIDSLMILNRTIDLKNKIMVESESDLIRRLIELAPFVNNLTNFSQTTKKKTTPHFYDYDSVHLTETLHSEVSTEWDDFGSSTHYEVR